MKISRRKFLKEFWKASWETPKELWKDLKELLKHLRSFAGKVDAEESLAANIVALVLFCGGGGLLAHGIVRDTTWTVVAGLIGLVVGALIFKANTAVAQYKVAEKMDNDRK